MARSNMSEGWAGSASCAYFWFYFHQEIFILEISLLIKKERFRSEKNYKKFVSTFLVKISRSENVDLWGKISMSELQRVPSKREKGKLF